MSRFTRSPAHKRLENIGLKTKTLNNRADGWIMNGQLSTHQDYRCREYSNVDLGVACYHQIHCVAQSFFFQISTQNGGLYVSSENSLSIGKKPSIRATSLLWHNTQQH